MPLKQKYMVLCRSRILLSRFVRFTICTFLICTVRVFTVQIHKYQVYTWTLCPLDRWKFVSFAHACCHGERWCLLCHCRRRRRSADVYVVNNNIAFFSRISVYDVGIVFSAKQQGTRNMVKKKIYTL